MTDILESLHTCACSRSTSQLQPVYASIAAAISLRPPHDSTIACPKARAAESHLQRATTMLRHVPPASLQRLSAALWSSGWVGIEALPAQHTREVATIVLVNAALQGQLLHAALRDSWSTRLQLLVMEDEETYRYAALVASDIAQVCSSGPDHSISQAHDSCSRVAERS